MPETEAAARSAARLGELLETTAVRELPGSFPGAGGRGVAGPGDAGGVRGAYLS